VQTRRKEAAPQWHLGEKRAGAPVEGLVAKITPQNRNSEFPSGPELGKEQDVWRP